MPARLAAEARERKNGQRHVAPPTSPHASVQMQRADPSRQRVATHGVDRSGPCPGKSGFAERSSTSPRPITSRGVSRAKILRRPLCRSLRRPSSPSFEAVPTSHVPTAVVPVTTISPLAGSTPRSCSACTHCAAVNPAVPQDPRSCAVSCWAGSDRPIGRHSGLLARSAPNAYCLIVTGHDHFAPTRKRSGSYWP